MRVRPLIALASLAALAVPLTASARINAERTGSFSASGTGTVVMNGNFTDAFGSKLRGTLIVRDPAGDAKVLIGGVPQKPKRVKVGDRIVRVFTIQRPNRAFAFHVKGTRVLITIKSPTNTLSVQVFGRGTVTRLDGEGTYVLNDDAETPWGEAPLPLKIKPPRPVRADTVLVLEARPVEAPA